MPSSKALEVNGTPVSLLVLWTVKCLFGALVFRDQRNDGRLKQCLFGVFLLS